MNGEPVLKQSQVYQRDKENAVVIRQYQDEIEKKKKELISKELERRKLQSNLDQERAHRDSLIKKEITNVSDSLYQYYRVQQKSSSNCQSVIIPIQPEETEDPADSQAKNKDIKLSCKSLSGYSLLAICFVSTYMWIGSKIYFI
jgi:excinuclease UvrABC helicase subunit UvrB